jgi:hypothetical protein
MPLSLLDLPTDCLWLITRALPASAWPPWRATCVAARDAVRGATTRLRVDVSRDGDLPLPALCAAACARLTSLELVSLKPRHEANPSLANPTALAALAGWLASDAVPPSAAVTVYVRCERASLDWGVVMKLAHAGLLVRARTLSIRADGVHGLTLPRDRCATAALGAGLAVTAEIKVGAPWCRLVGVLASWPLTKLAVIAAAPGAATGPLGWLALRRAAATLAELHLCAGVPLADALGGGDVAWPVLTRLTVAPGDEAVLESAWLAAAAPKLRGRNGG